MLLQDTTTPRHFSLRQFLTLRNILLGAVVYLLLRGTVLRPSLEQQVDRCFAAITTGFAERDPGDILAQVSIDYPYLERWPQFDDALQVRRDPEGDIRYQRRQRVQQVLGQMFFVLKRSSPQFSFEIIDITDDPVTPKATVRIEHTSVNCQRVFDCNAQSQRPSPSNARAGYSLQSSFVITRSGKLV